MSDGLKKLLTLLVIVFILFVVIAQPADAATAVDNSLNWLESVAQSITKFITEVFN